VTAVGAANVPIVLAGILGGSTNLLGSTKNSTPSAFGFGHLGPDVGSSRGMKTDSHVEELNARTGGASGLRYSVGRSCRGWGLILRLTLRASTGSLWDHECHYVKARQERRTGANSRDNRTYAQYVLHDEIA
jgi:hypothetical protein